MINDNMRFITRTSDGGGWRVGARRNGKAVISKVFSDLFHRGINNALTEAKSYRNSIQDDIEKASKSIFAGISNPPFYKVAFKNSKSQVVDVSKLSLRRRDGRSFFTWIGKWQDSSLVSKSKSFSVSKYGEEGAFKLAFEARQKGISERMKIENKMVLVK